MKNTEHEVPKPQEDESFRDRSMSASRGNVVTHMVPATMVCAVVATCAETFLPSCCASVARARNLPAATLGDNFSLQGWGISPKRSYRGTIAYGVQGMKGSW